METELRNVYAGILRPGQQPYDFQLDVGRRLLAGDNVLLHAPTGCGKTRAVLVPFIIGRRRGRWRRLIYVLPLRALANSIHVEAQKTLNGTGYVATIQTGEQPQDPFFASGDVVVCTYDQLLSGLLGAPYGLGLNLANINAGSIAGSLVVFDEFHLMEPGRAFLTAVSMLYLFRDLCQSVWMTATATSPLENLLCNALGTRVVRPTTVELGKVPAVVGVKRTLQVHNEPLTAEAILANHKRRTIVVTNQVRWSQALYRDLRSSSDVPAVLLHSLFFRTHRSNAEQKIREWFGPGSQQEGIAIATQTIEAGIDATSDDIHIHECPMNSFVQRAGRNARFPKSDGSLVEGTVHLWPLPNQYRPWLPYDRKLLEATSSLLREHDGGTLQPSLLAEWVDTIHKESDLADIATGWHSRLEECLRGVHMRVILRKPDSVAHLIREVNRVRVIIRNQPPDDPWAWDGFSLRPDQIQKAVAAGGQPVVWGRTAGPDEQPDWIPINTPHDVRGAYYLFCLHPSVAGYDSEVGLQLGAQGNEQSPTLPLPQRPGHGAMGCERWTDHSRQVTRCCEARADEELNGDSLLLNGLQRRYRVTGEEILSAVRSSGLLHDLAKLQLQWQKWALNYQSRKNPSSPLDRALAHTDYDGTIRDRLLSDTVTGEIGRRPPHAGPGALYAIPVLTQLCPPVNTETQMLLLAVIAAILGHHGGWLGRENQPELGAGPFWTHWAREVAELLSVPPSDPILARTEMVAAQTRKRDQLERFLKPVCGPDALADNWPLIAYLTRTLRLSDQKATAEGSDAP